MSTHRVVAVSPATQVELSADISADANNVDLSRMSERQQLAYLKKLSGPSNSFATPINSKKRMFDQPTPIPMELSSSGSDAEEESVAEQENHNNSSDSDSSSHHEKERIMPLSARQIKNSLIVEMPLSRRLTALELAPKPIWRPTEYYSHWANDRRKKWDDMRNNPNAYYYHYTAPGLMELGAKWNKTQILELVENLIFHPPYKQWGLFAMNLYGRTGQACEIAYRTLIKHSLITGTGKKTELFHAFREWDTLLVEILSQSSLSNGLKEGAVGPSYMHNRIIDVAADRAFNISAGHENERTAPELSKPFKPEQQQHNKKTKRGEKEKEKPAKKVQKLQAEEEKDIKQLKVNVAASSAVLNTSSSAIKASSKPPATTTPASNLTALSEDIAQRAIHYDFPCITSSFQSAAAAEEPVYNYYSDYPTNNVNSFATQEVESTRFIQPAAPLRYDYHLHDCTLSLPSNEIYSALKATKPENDSGQNLLLQAALIQLDSKHKVQLGRLKTQRYLDLERIRSQFVEDSYNCSSGCSRDIGNFSASNAFLLKQYYGNNTELLARAVNYSQGNKSLDSSLLDCKAEYKNLIKELDRQVAINRHILLQQYHIV
jgi:hypothetical protein